MNKVSIFKGYKVRTYNPWNEGEVIKFSENFKKVNKIRTNNVEDV